MIHKYKIVPQNQERVTIPDGTDPISFDNCRATWIADRKDKLEKIELEIFGLPIKKDEKGIILSSYPEVDALAFNFAAYLANFIFIQTSIDPFDPYLTLSGSPEILAENEDEEIEMQTYKSAVHTSFDAKLRILGKFNPAIYESNYSISIAIGHFAEAWRSNNPFQKFECFFKVIESLFQKRRNEKAEVFDQRVSEYAVRFDPLFTQDVVQNFRQIRNRCAHPDNPAHLSPINLESIRVIQSELKNIQKLARLLLDNPVR